jgi:two-component system cell cycle sensor histidine kinase/response regulator CckA
LVVEDEGLIAHDISRRLESLGHQVIASVSTAEEAIEQAAGADLVLMDIHIDGGRDGIDAALEIRARYRVPVVFLTAHADRATLDRAKTAGPFGYVVKPLGPASLHTAIEMATYRHRSERELEEREAWYRATLHSAADAVIAVDVSGHVRTLNQAGSALTGWSPERAAGRKLETVLRFVDERSGEVVGDLVARALLRDAPLMLDPVLTQDPAVTPERGDLRLVPDPNRLVEGRVVEGSIAPVKTSSETLGAVLTLRDVTNRRWEERQLRQCQRMEAAGRLAASISSDYGTLLATIRNQAARLLEQFGEYSPARNAAEAIHQAAAAADQLTRRLSTFGMRQVAQPQLMSLNRVVRHLAKLIDSVASSKIAGNKIKVSLRLEAESGEAQIDPALMEQAIMNLVMHACAAILKDGSEGGRLSLGTKRSATPLSEHTGGHVGGHPAEFVMLEIEYSATEADLEHLFDPAPSGDTGLALPVAYSIVTEHNGFLTARSCALNGGSGGGEAGTCIELLLPRAEVDRASTDPDTSVQPAPPVLLPSVLLMDPREAVRAELHNFFESAGFNLLEAGDRNEAIALGQLREDPLDLIIADALAADALLDALRDKHPALEALRLVDEPERSPNEIRRPFTQQALIGQVRTLLASRTVAPAAANQ